MTLLSVLSRAEPPPPPGYPDVDPPSCQLLGPTALIVQGLMGLLVMLSLVYKRHRETPKRPWKIWIFDVSKQVAGQLFVHGTNLLVSGLVSHHTDGNACISYFLNILIDTTFGILLIYVTLSFLTYLFTEKFQVKGFESGVYGDPPSINYWARQAALYILSLTTMKAVVIAFLAFVPGIYVAGEWLLSWTYTDEGDALQVIIVMGIFPILMNVLQFWIIDSIVKASNRAPFMDLERGPGEYQDQEPLFRAPSEDADDGDPSLTRHLGRRHANSSISSVDSKELDGNSFATTDTTPGTTPGEFRSSASSSKQVSDVHNYPPSLSSSFSSDTSTSHSSSKVPREAKNLQKKAKRRDPSALQHSLPPRIVLPTQSPKHATVPLAEDSIEWTESWGHSDDWDREHQKQNSLPTPGQWNNSTIQNIH